jgi:hypothetical protein
MSSKHGVDVGSRVECQFAGGKEWFPAVVVRAAVGNGDKEEKDGGGVGGDSGGGGGDFVDDDEAEGVCFSFFDVEYDDGDFEKQVPSERVRAVQQGGLVCGGCGVNDDGKAAAAVGAPLPSSTFSSPASIEVSYDVVFDDQGGRDQFVPSEKVKRMVGPGEKEALAISDMLRLLRSQEPKGSKERCWNWKHSSLEIHATLAARGTEYNGYPVLPGYFGAFCMDGLAMALWSVYHSASFDDAIERCVNLLGDADSTAAVCGQLAGAFYGAQAINPAFVRNLEQWDDGDTAVRTALLYLIENSRR